jgi:hypothetical protein
MQSLNARTPHAAVDEADAPVDIVYLDNSMLENRVVSECGRFESFDFRGQHFEVDWDEIAPPGAEEDDEEGTPHEEFMEEMRLYCEELDRRGARR